MDDIVFRDMRIDASRANDEDRIVSASLSSINPVERFFGWEILSHDKSAVDLSRAVDGLPLLYSHDSEKILGIIEDVKIEGNNLRGRLRFGNSAQAREVWPDVKAGIIKNISVGYIVNKTEQTGERDGVPEFTVTRWMPMEASLLAIPADISVGVGRKRETLNLKGKNKMKDDKNLSRSDRKREAGDLNNTREVESERVREINALASQHSKTIPGLFERAADAIQRGDSIESFQADILDNLSNKESVSLIPARSFNGGGSSSGGQRFSLQRAISALIDPKEQKRAGYELEVSNDLAKRMGRETSGIFVPVGELSKREITVGGTGSNWVATDFQGNSFIDVLRASSIVMQRATLLPGLIGDVDIPKKSSGSTAYWIGGEGSDSITGSTPVLSKLSLSPKTVGALVTVSHKMMTQSGINIDDMLMQDMADVIATEIDAKAIAGDGLGNTPTGIINTSGVLTSTIASAGNPTFAELVEFETDVLNSNVVDSERLTYLTTPTVAGSLKTTVKDSGSGLMLWENGMANGRPAQASNNVPANGIIFGDFSNVIIGTWGVVEILADPYGSNFATGSVSLRVLFDVDVALRYPGAFCINA